MFKVLLNPLKAFAENSRSVLVPTEQASVENTEGSSDEITRVAVIQGRHCLAYQKSFCSVCYEQCPEEGAIEVKQGIPIIVGGNCTGCRVCHDVCPAPVNAILMIEKKA